jgi:UDP-3-O-[3-hydroxymyristoyl] N-acetylglucosamine deacetylase / 3-hydroxyacyl-[acyl-carrier-protein] dehydratase
MASARQQTIRSEATLEGVGLHSGEQVRLRVLPAEPNRGVVFRRVDLDPPLEVPADIDLVVDTERGTTLGLGDVRIRTVEHLMAAISGLGIDNVVVEMDAEEPPAADGSAAPFVEMLRSAGIEEQSAVARIVRVDEPFSVEEGESSFVMAPAAGFEVAATIEFDHPLVSRQFGSFRIEPERFEREIAGARTFGFLREVEALRARGLALGGSVANAVVLTDEGLAEGSELRFADEFVRHKALDVIGDLALVGGRVEGRVVADRPSHRGNVALGRELRRRAARAGNGQPILDIQQILQYLPHRYPFLLVDRVIEFEEGKRIVGIKNVTINEPFFMGHFPGHPVMPGVLIIEAMAQVGGLLVLENVENIEEKVIYFLGLDNVRWRRPVTPGDQIRFEVELTKVRGATVRMKGVGTVDGQLAAEAEMMARIVDR